MTLRSVIDHPRRDQSRKQVNIVNLTPTSEKSFSFRKTKTRHTSYSYQNLTHILPGTGITPLVSICSIIFKSITLHNIDEKTVCQIFHLPSSTRSFHCEVTNNNFKKSKSDPIQRQILNGNRFGKKKRDKCGSIFAAASLID